MWGKWISLLMSTALCVASISTHAETASLSNNFMSIADIHFDPYAGCPHRKRSCELIDQLKNRPIQEWEGLFAQYGDKRIANYYSDTNYLLLKSVLEELKRVKEEKNPKFVLILGDFLSHKFRLYYRQYSKNNSNAAYEAFVKKIFAFLALEFQQTYPDIDVYLAVGNNDTYTGNYSVIPKGRFLHDVSDLWKPLIKDERNQESFLKTFEQAGYYELTVPDSPQNKIIILNTVLFSQRSDTEAEEDAAEQQLQWLHARLVDARRHHQHVLLAYHIPMGIDVFATMNNNFRVKEFWQEKYNQQFENELHQFASEITAVFPAHIHTTTFQNLILKQVDNIPVKLTTSVSPIFGNNPEFKVFSYNLETFQIINNETYDYPLNWPLPEWRYQTFLETHSNHYNLNIKL